MKPDMEPPWKPTREQLMAADGKTIKDILAPELDVLFVGINPGLYSAAIGHHFGRPGNRFWPALHAAGFTPRVLTPFEEQLLLEYRLGITNMVTRASSRADELTANELIEGGRVLTRKVKRYRPRFVALLGVTSYRIAFGRKEAQVGRQPEPIGKAVAWLLPNPSGLNAHYQLEDLAKLFTELRKAVQRS